MRSSSKVAAAAAIAVASTTVLVSTPSPEPAAAVVVGAPSAARPNIVLISSDDQTDMELQWMPQTKGLLGDAGINFTDGINPHPLCCPARAEILTGEYGHNNGVHHNVGPWGGHQAFVANGHLEQNIAVWLQDAGYRTGFVGKALNGYKEDSEPLAGWDYWSPTVAKTYAYYGTTFLNNGVPQTYPETYVADVVGAQSVEMVQDWSNQEEPFFIWASHVGPHGAINEGEFVEGPAGRQLSARVSGRAAPVPAVRHQNTFDDLALPTKDKPSFTETGELVSDKPASVRKKSFPREQVEELFQRRVESLQAIDEANAATISALDASGELDNTVVVYVSDNGYQLGEHGLEGKSQPYQESLQIPFLMRAPDMAAGQELPLTASLVDLAPTFLSYAGVLGKIRRQGRTDGLSLRRAARRGMPNDTTLIQAGAPKTEWQWRGVRTSRYTYVDWTDGSAELYDRRVDPFELENLLDPDTGTLQVPRYAAVLAELARRYRLLQNCSGVYQCESRDFGSLPAAKNKRRAR